ncbi:MAG: acetoacetate--CoA ligase [Chromatiales bacterium]|nr:acetoacetate--CoA ligase [Chromatiales bacterium]
MTGEILWQPDADRARRAHLTRFIDRVVTRQGIPVADYPSLHRWSVQSPGAFWGELAAFCDLRWRRFPDAVLEHAERNPGARWFPGGTLNFAENLLRFRDDRPALIWRDEAGSRGELSYRQLHDQVARAAAGLRRLGVGPGDRVAAFLPNGPEAVIGMLASTSLGGIWSSCSPDFGAAAVLDRFGQIAPKVLIAAAAYRYAGKRVDTTATVKQLGAQLPGLEAVVGVGDLPDSVPWAELTAAGLPLEFHAAPFDHPVYILYSSGTTGPPKGIVHGAGGALLQHLKEHLLHTDLHRDDRLFYFTTCGWMMWNWLVSGLASGVTLVLYDGSPTHPDPEALWRLAGEEAITVFGTSPRYLAGLAKAGTRPRERIALPALRTVLSTGSPLPPESFDYVYDAVKADVQLSSISGGTDIVACFALGNPLLPVRRGELQCAALGMAVEIFDPAGHPLATGRGELVCTGPFPSQPVGFWGDADGEKYRRAYFERFSGSWAHGDYAERTAAGGFLIHGRSDSTLNPGGVRIGTAELYRAVESVAEVRESLAVGQRWQGDERILLFVVLGEGAVLDAALAERIRATVRRELSPRHVPAMVLQVPDLPRTRSGKLSELAVRAVVHGEPPGNVEALANPEALQHFRERAELAV